MLNKQRHSTSCGPTSIVNALRFKGYADTYEEIVDYCKAKGLWAFKRGMSPIQIYKALFYLGLDVTKVWHMTIKLIRKEINNGNGMLLMRASPALKGNHYVFIDACEKDRIRVWNNGADSPWYLTKDLNKQLRTHLFGNAPNSKAGRPFGFSIR